MELRPAFQIPALIKSLTDVVLPAIDPANKLAQEQAQLIVGTLHLMAQRMPLQYRYDRHELGSFVALADELAGHGAAIPEVAAALASLADGAAGGRALLARAGVEPAELEASNQALREQIGAVITAAATAADSPALKAVNRAVLAHSKDLLLRERSWLAMQGWEGKDPAHLPAAETLIG